MPEVYVHEEEFSELLGRYADTLEVIAVLSPPFSLGRRRAVSRA